MIDYADRVGRIPPYLFAEIDRAIERKKRGGVDVISFGIGDPDLDTPGHILDALDQAARKPANQKYPSYIGMQSFREAVAGWYKKRFKVELNPAKEVVTLIGSKEGIGHLPLALINPGDTVLVPDPAYPVYRIGTILADGEPYVMPLLEENGFKPDLGAIPKDVAGKAKLMYLNYPNNPTAATVDKKYFEEVVGFARENNIVVAHDAPYSEVSFDGYRAPSFLEVDGASEVGVEFHSLSKTYNMTGFRIGFVVGNSGILAGLGKVKENIDSGAFRAVQEAGIAALEGPQDCVRENNRILQERRDLMVGGLKELGLEASRPKATFYLWVRCPDGRESLDYCRRVLDKTGVVFTPGVGFGAHGEGYFRVALTQSKERIKEALERLKETG